MAFDDRFLYLVSGAELGFFAGYITRTLREIREGVKEGNEMLRNGPSRKRDERGVANSMTLNRVALALVIAITVFASFKSQAASNHADESLRQTRANQHQLSQVVTCLVTNQTAFLNAVNTRTTFTRDQATANKVLQEAQKVFFGVILHVPPYTEAKRTEAARAYQTALDDFLDAANASERNAVVTPYPDSRDLLNCIESKSHK